ncbi:ATP synthase F1 subunit gamma [candidate division WWE3 bacterium]|uniref:ATP synthase gamma chain n=1 Tax=candidate division WWE3 bacterium TaxID=2053526 RepID=A0A955LGY2_UNCKA|nr:ATP synthase F1 subunit gamma [candidate division WWE3 bacterium]
MGKTREIKKRIKSVNNISQVTNAMQLVAASRMKKAQENAEKGKSYSEQIKQIMLKLSLNKTITDDPFIDPAYSQDAQADMIIVFSPQRGLAGALPSNLVRFATKFGNDIASAGRAVQLVTVGQKIRQQLANQPWEFVADFSDMPEQPTTADMRPLIKLIRDSYVNREIHRAYLIYPGFINALTQIPTARLLLPLDLEGLELSHETESLNTEMKSNSVYMFEPTREEIFEELIPAYIETQLYQTRLETIASEYSARMVAMKGATDNAKELKGDLTILYNKSRQAQITQEVAEINAVRSRN